ncbi:helix-turn-helix transcriptional regulator [Aeromonas hydrophila]|uniref:helix-turn-helix transcriptional regulator n=1 Tax=Aeromonas hydrophila TaxID=644 RepID=UPI0016528578|nr:AraC family transcriptional regulator [Aeromonas hydrophila]MCF7680449.1 AraC family transcriptional regulator [Aeromonas hydrophila]MCF7690858.1 AraC family transcriptional regulator [Aeromonas hydrophila]MCF7772021.1 AraC family transcriptional regulator [Aeromonas hydrophila]MDL5386178.1 AraC family transcriptional regulator [Aeromonas hydrophila]BCO11946.1 AraC family transcriptional regulator [Aeromonas hydrophila]
MMSETANTDLVDVSPDCREQICCDSLLPALAQEQVWLAGYSRLKTRYRIARRFADVHCFLLTLGGEGEVQVGDRRERLQVGEWALIPAGEPLCYQLSEQMNEPLNQQVNKGSEWELVWLLLHKDSPWDAFASHPRLGCTSQQATVLRTLENLYAEQERHQDPLLSALLVEQLGFYLRRLLQKGEGQRRGERLALRLELLLKEALTEPWDIARMAGALHLSERQLYRLCQQHFALAPMALLQRLRLQRAALLLASRADSVKRLAEQCGFKNEYHFSTAFKRQHGLAPSHYRSLHHPAFKTGQG